MEKSPMTCNEFDELLLDGGEAAMGRAQAHAATCAACRITLDDWLDISATARSLRAEWPSDTLWPRIERQLRQPATGRRQWYAVAAALFIAVAIASVALYALHLRGRRAAFDQAILRAGALDEVERAEQAHVAAIDRLERLAGPRLDEPATPLLVSYKEKLMLLDDAIAECEKAVDQNRQNAHLRRQLLAIYAEKQRTLQDVLRQEEGTANANP
jgi:hypothetical protein